MQSTNGLHEIMVMWIYFSRWNFQKLMKAFSDKNINQNNRNNKDYHDMQTCGFAHQNALRMKKSSCIYFYPDGAVKLSAPLLDFDCFLKVLFPALVLVPLLCFLDVLHCVQMVTWETWIFISCWTKLVMVWLFNALSWCTMPWRG